MKKKSGVGKGSFPTPPAGTLYQLALVSTARRRRIYHCQPLSAVTIKSSSPVTPSAIFTTERKVGRQQGWESAFALDSPVEFSAPAQKISPQNHCKPRVTCVLPCFWESTTHDVLVFFFQFHTEPTLFHLPLPPSPSSWRRASASTFHSLSSSYLNP